MISKELLSEVLGYKVEIEESEHWLKSSNSVVFVDLSRKGDITDTDFINIYELAHKCKEWAFDNGGYVLQSQSYAVKNYKFTKSAFCYTHFPMDGMGNSHWADTEVEAIFKACQWILDNKDD